MGSNMFEFNDPFSNFESSSLLDDDLAMNNIFSSDLDGIPNLLGGTEDLPLSNPIAPPPAPLSDLQQDKTENLLLDNILDMIDNNGLAPQTTNTPQSFDELGSASSNFDFFGDFDSSSRKPDVPLEPVDVVCGGSTSSIGSSNTGPSSPTDSNVSEASTDSGVDESCGNSHTQVTSSPEHEEVLLSSPLLSPDSSTTPQPSPSSSDSGVSSVVEQISPQSSNNSSYIRSSSRPSGLSNLNTISLNSSSPTPQFIVRKTPISSLKSNSKPVGFPTKITVPSANLQPVTLVTSSGSTASSTTIIRNTGQRIVLNKSKFLHKSPIIRSTQSSSPSVVTLSGVNKTTGITKSPKISSVSSTQLLNAKNISLLGSNAPVFKTTTNGAKKITSLTQATNGKVIYLADLEKNPNMAFKLFQGTNNSSGAESAIRTVKHIFNKRTDGVYKPVTIRRDGYISSFSPKEEPYSDDEEFETPKRNMPLILTDEEKKLAIKEGIKFPDTYPLNKLQERDLKKIKRKIRNKISAQDSRKRKKEYVDALESKIKRTEIERDDLRSRVQQLEETESRLKRQIEEFKTVMSAHPISSSHSSSKDKNHHPTTFLFMMLLGVSMFLYQSPNQSPSSELLTTQKMPQTGGTTRSLLEAAATQLSHCPSETLPDKSPDEVAQTGALNDHDYAPPQKKIKLDYLDYSEKKDSMKTYCSSVASDEAPPFSPPGDDTGGTPPSEGEDFFPLHRKRGEDLRVKEEDMEIDLQEVEVVSPKVERVDDLQSIKDESGGFMRSLLESFMNTAWAKEYLKPPATNHSKGALDGLKDTLRVQLRAKSLQDLELE